ncbi:rho GTPase-activating protein SYDE1-like [Hemitrygon akajei]|uniref:rho GTPase-activating protein SYDE1-like n=1 Tax=Hemitrygon akajei TaxID=2704970 RepID=UPI003BF9848F
MAEPLFRKTFAKLRARRRKSLKGARSEDPEVPDTAATATNGENNQTMCAIGEEQSNRDCTSGSSRSLGTPAPPCGTDSGMDCTNRATCVSSLARSSSPEQDTHTARQSEVRRDRVGEGAIWYNPIPEDEYVMPVPRKPGSSKAVWYVEMPQPSEAETGTGDGARKPSCLAAASCSERTLESRTIRCPAESSPPKSRAPSHPVTATGVSWSCSQQGSSTQKTRQSDGAADVQMESNQGLPPSPRPAKKRAAAHRSLSDRVKSPGTVRRLSMRMRRLPDLRRKLSLRGTSRSAREGPAESGPRPAAPPSGPPLPPSDRNVICRYHLDSSVSARGSQPRPAKPRGARSLSRPGYLSDGDSPEMAARAGKLGSRWLQGLDTASFRPYGGGEPPRCLQYLSGLIHIRLFGIEGVRPPRPGLRDIFCTIQVDSVSKARTALLTCRDSFLSLDHAFNIELEHSQQLKMLIFTWDPSSCRNRICCHGTALLPPLFRGTRTHQLALQLEPRGVLYLKVSLVEVWEVPAGYADEQREPRVFRMELSDLVERERSGVSVPLLIQKCVSEIEKRGLKAVGLYRLCGSAAVKKELRDAFERDSASVDLSEDMYPDINVITGILKDYLRELPSPLITKTLYDVVLETTATWPLKMSSGVPEASLSAVNAVVLLDCLPPAEKATLTLLLDHLSLVASLQESNKMTCQNLAVCFGPVLLGQKQENSQHGSCAFSHSKELANALDFKRHIEVLHYLLQLWPSERIREKRDVLMERPVSTNCLRPRARTPAGSPVSEEVVCRTRVGRSASSSRYRHAGDWSSCGRNLLRTGNDQEAGDRDRFTSLDTSVPGSLGPADPRGDGPHQTELRGGSRVRRADTWGRGTYHTDTWDRGLCHTNTRDRGARHTDTREGSTRHMDTQDSGPRHTEIRLCDSDRTGVHDTRLLHAGRWDSGPRHTASQDSSFRHTDTRDCGSTSTSRCDYDLYPVNGRGDKLFPDSSHDGGLFPDGGELDFESSLGGRTKEFDSLIADIERELAKKIIFL